MPTDENIVKALSEQRGQFPIELLLPRQDTIDLCQDKHALNLFLRPPAIPAPLLTYNVNSLKDLDRDLLLAFLALVFSGVVSAVVYRSDGHNCL